MSTQAYLANWYTYQAAWAALSATERQAMLRESVAEDCIYTDPVSVSHGHDELIVKMESTQRNRLV